MPTFLQSAYLVILMISICSSKFFNELKPASIEIAHKKKSKLFMEKYKHSNILPKFLRVVKDVYTIKWQHFSKKSFVNISAVFDRKMKQSC